MRNRKITREERAMEKWRMVAPWVLIAIYVAVGIIEKI